MDIHICIQVHNYICITLIYNIYIYKELILHVFLSNNLSTYVNPMSSLTITQKGNIKIIFKQKKSSKREIVEFAQNVIH